MTDAERIEDQVWAAVCLVVQRRVADERRRVWKDHAEALRDLAEQGLNPAEMANRIDPRPAFTADGHLRADPMPDRWAEGKYRSAADREEFFEQVRERA